MRRRDDLRSSPICASVVARTPCAKAANEVSRKRHLSRGKLLPRDRIRAADRPGFRPFSRWAQLAAHGLYDGEVPSAGIITGIGRVAGARVHGGGQRCDGERRYLFSAHREEASARPGDRAGRTGCLASIWWIAGGANLPNQDEVFPDRDHFGRIFYNQAQMSAAGIAQSRRRHGLVHRWRRLCARDVRRKHHRAQPRHDLPRRATLGEGRHRVKSSPPRSLGGADVHSRVSGVTDHYAENDAHALGHCPPRSWAVFEHGQAAGGGTSHVRR